MAITDIDLPFVGRISNSIQHRIVFTVLSCFTRQRWHQATHKGLMPKEEYDIEWVLNDQDCETLEWAVMNRKNRFKFTHRTIGTVKMFAKSNMSITRYISMPPDKKNVKNGYFLNDYANKVKITFVKSAG